jgi:hypothetical protein
MENKNTQEVKSFNSGEGVTETQKNKLNVFEVFGYKIKENSCTALEYTLFVKRFDEYVVRGMPEERGFTMNHIKVHELLKDAISTKVELASGDDDHNAWLIIETEDVRVSIMVPHPEGGEN